ncbi:cytochrome P450 (plasmid) [Pseudonocardia sp. EC080625-04]|uniref:cytochrome P450 n=1 Tax=unclassified Pseudonocardia TaxID=2619320 RepID=UPI0006CB4C7D|nr:MULTISPECIES: cytochrome P450 [unclassified Pseudonocardia]ALE76831.1 cytochrome P450 [Pseudonocardia sp. EC080625-04]ALE86278.1 hypothetical protein XF36_26670 [Pseudonocardia sp. HH130629-09]
MTRPIIELTPEQASDPVHGYTELREEAPLVRVILPGTTSPVLLASRYADVRAIMTDPRFERDRAKVPGEQVPDLGAEMNSAWGIPPEYEPYLTSLVMMNGPEHARLRAKVVRTMSARRVSRGRARVESLADELVAELAGREQFDLMTDFCYPLASRAVFDLLGIEERHREKVSRWIRQFVSGATTADVVEGLDGIVELSREMIAVRRHEPADDVISAMIADADPTTDDEIISMVFLLINTGQTPPVLFVTNSVLTLLDHPDQLARLRAEPALLGSAMHELLRWTTPVTIGATAYAREDLEISGCPVRRGEAVTYGLLAADHDPAVFDAPDRLDITRETPARGEEHLAFGAGAHYCLGAALAKAQAEVAFDRLLLSGGDLELAVPRDRLEYDFWPGEGNHLLGLPVRFATRLQNRSA